MTTGRLGRAALLATPLTVVLAATGCGVPAGGPGATPPAAPGMSTTVSAGDEVAVRGLLERINDAWARGDATAYASYHTPDADLIDFRVIHALGRQEIVDLLQPAFDTVLKDTRVEARIVDLRFLGPDVAILHTEGQVVPTGAASVQTFVATRTDGEWAIAAFQNTRIQSTP